MPVFALNEKINFPPVEFAEENGILAVGGDLSRERLIEAYSRGIFPWYSEEDPIIWWSPDPRFVLYPGEVRVSRSMRKIMKKETFAITYDRGFSSVISECRKPRRKETETWITEEMKDAYRMLHEAGLAHSVEAWQQGEIVGGLYGISLGGCFFGESMFTRVSNASKVALIALAQKLHELDFLIIDCQVYTDHLKSLGAVNIPRSKFISILEEGLTYPTITGNWGEREEFTRKHSYS